MTTDTATLTKSNGYWIVRFVRDTSLTVGEQMFGHINPALRFCRERGLRVIVV